MEWQFFNKKDWNTFPASIWALIIVIIIITIITTKISAIELLMKI